MNIRRHRYLYLAVTFVFSLTSAAAPAAATTPASVTADAVQTASELRELAAQLEAGAAGTAADVAEKLTTAAAALETAAATDAGAQLDATAAELRHQAEVLAAATAATRSLLAAQPACGNTGQNLLAAGLATVAARLDAEPPFVAADAPRLDALVFPGHRVGVVPASGSTVELVGRRLWADDGQAPTLALLDEDRQTSLAEPVAARGEDADHVSTSIDRELLAAHEGKCLWLRATAHRVERGWFSSEVIDLPATEAPLCIPGPEQPVMLRLRAELTFSCGSTTLRDGEPLVIRVANDDCKQERQVSETRDLTLPEGCSLVGVASQVNTDGKGDLGARFGFFGSTITATGRLDKAECSGIGFLRRKRADAVWSHTVTPRLSCSDRKTVTVKAASDAAVASSLGEGGLCVDLARSCDPTESKTRVSLDYGFGTEPALLAAEWASVALRAEAVELESQEKSGWQLSGRVDPKAAARTTRVCATAAAPACAY